MPALDLPALKRHIADRRLSAVYLLVGEDLKLVDRMVDGLESVIDPADRPFAIDRLYAGENGGTPLAIASSARMLAMLGDRRLVIVMRAERLLKPKRAAKAEQEDVSDGESEQAVDAGPLEEYLQNPVSSSTLVFVASEIDRTRRLTKRLLEKAQVVEFGGLGNAGGGRDARHSPAADWLREELAREGRTIDPDAARLLVSRCGNDITKLRADVERLLLYAEGRKRIGTDDVLEVVVDANAVEDEWAVINAIGDGNAALALAEVGRRMERGDSPHGLVGQLRWWVSSRLAQADPSRVRPALEALLRTDLALKSSGGDERVVMERLVVELTGKPVAASRGWTGKR
ncbi:MAG: DNA polymerase III subunit delta [Vicinamibacterales bacterium]